METNTTKTKKPKSKPKVKKIVVGFICTGNTCRSPVMEYVFKDLLRQKKKLSKYKVYSAGLSVSVGDGMAFYSSEVLGKNGIAVKAHSSKFLSHAHIKETDYFICMTQGHKNALSCLKDKKVFTVGEITGGADVIDPYGGTLSEYEKMYEHLAYSAEDILEFIMKNEE